MLEKQGQQVTCYHGTVRRLRQGHLVQRVRMERRAGRFPPERLIWQRVSEEEQAVYTVRGIEYVRAHWPWAGVFNIWYFRQVGHMSPERADYYFRMVDVDFTPRRLYEAVREVATKRGSPTW